jgi:hypothetical protein
MCPWVGGWGDGLARTRVEDCQEALANFVGISLMMSTNLRMVVAWWMKGVLISKKEKSDQITSTTSVWRDRSQWQYILKCMPRVKNWQEASLPACLSALVHSCFKEGAYIGTIIVTVAAWGNLFHPTHQNSAMARARNEKRSLLLRL